MSFNYTKVRRTSDSLIAKFGTTVYIRRIDINSESSPWDPAQTGYTDYESTALITGYEESSVDGTLIKNDDKKVLLSAQGLDITPDYSDKLIYGTQEYEIRNISPLAPGGTVVLYELQIRP